MKIVEATNANEGFGDTRYVRSRPTGTSLPRSSSIGGSEVSVDDPPTDDARVDQEHLRDSGLNRKSGECRRS
jgi:hypothetical protein